ncbi:EF-hand domain-containing protein [Flavobacterium sp. NG2]|uniref:EF-hand domain-containing protein n=1 Tax=Flavobacterium sp. NG2 TaxID=3097547 RepID=UPI002A80F79B|nr:EF-hand domain-containing protein [Flavobacterium sp. NG2]WPR71930.1 EF-hand domain-containing protein [Flavobacterium sp. NG2]
MKINNLKTILFSALFLLIGTVVSFGQNDDKPKDRKPPTIEELFKQMDANKDGKLSKEEIKGPLKDDFAKIDTNKDGFLTKEELKKAPKPEGRRPENKN